MTFEQWKRKVNAILESKTGLGIDDLADGPSYDNWEAGTSELEYAFILCYEYNDMDYELCEELFGADNGL